MAKPLFSLASKTLALSCSRSTAVKTCLQTAPATIFCLDNIFAGRWRPTRPSVSWTVSQAGPRRLYHDAPGTELRNRGAHHESISLLKDKVCSITAVDFSEQRVERQELDNHTLQAYLAKRRPDWSRCRWISVNGLSRDVINALSENKQLHRLAVEDMVHRRNRTKVDWYADHAFGVFDTNFLPSLSS